MQAAVRRRIVRSRIPFYKTLRRERVRCQWAKRIRLRTLTTRITRDKETYFVQRCSIGRIETDAINRYIRQTEKKFEENWSQYETQLEKHLTQSGKEFKDWIQCKESGEVFWLNRNSGERSTQHPGIKIFNINKKLLKSKAEEELRMNFTGINSRQLAIIDAIIDLKGRISTEI